MRILHRARAGLCIERVRREREELASLAAEDGNTDVARLLLALEAAELS